MRVIFVCGSPFSGKTTIATYIAQRFCYEYCGVGDWLRIMRDRKTDLGTYIRDNYTYDCLDPLVTEFVASKVKYSDCIHNDIVIDGYPRTPTQAQTLPRICINNNFIVLELSSVSRNEAVRRAMIREWAPPYGALAAEDDGGGEEEYHHQPVSREDVERRFDGYEFWLEKMHAVLRGTMCLYTIDASQDIDLVVEQVIQVTESSRGILVPVLSENAAFVPATAMETAVAFQFSMNITGLSGKRRRFVGSHPVSLQREHFVKLQRFPYLVSRKWDGERVMILMREGRTWILMRNFTVLKGKWRPDVAEKWNNTLIDAEWIPQSSTCCIIDCLVCDGVNLMTAPILQRLHACRLVGSVIADSVTTVRFQRYYAMADMRFLIEKSINATLDRCDGIIFTPQSLPYRASRDRNMYKFKCLEDNTVDLLMKRGSNALYVRADDESSDTTTAAVANDDDDDSSPPLLLKEVGELSDEEPRLPLVWTAEAATIILECLPRNNGKWRAIKQRMDRSEPNAQWVAERVCASILENITILELVNFSGVR